MPLDPNLYPTYPTGTKGLDPLIFKNYTSYVLGYVYLIFEQPVGPQTNAPHFVGY